VRSRGSIYGTCSVLVARLTLQSTVVLVDVDQAGRSDAGIGVDDDDDDVVVVVVVVVVVLEAFLHMSFGNGVIGTSE